MVNLWPWESRSISSLKTSNLSCISLLLFKHSKFEFQILLLPHSPGLKIYFEEHYNIQYKVNNTDQSKIFDLVRPFGIFISNFAGFLNRFLMNISYFGKNLEFSWKRIHFDWKIGHVQSVRYRKGLVLRVVRASFDIINMDKYLKFFKISIFYTERFILISFYI